MIGALLQVGALFHEVLQHVVAVGVLRQRHRVVHELVSKLEAHGLDGAVLKHTLHHSAAVAVLCYCHNVGTNVL